MRKAALLVLLAAAAVPGCGGGGGGTRQSTAITPADPAYAKKADVICQHALERTRRLGRAFSESEITPATPDLLALTTEKLVRPGIAIRAQMARQLRRLPPPKRGGEAVTAYLQLFDPLEELSRSRLQAGGEHDLDAAQRLEGLMQELAEEQEAAARLAGLQTCASNFVSAAFGSPSGS